MSDTPRTEAEVKFGLPDPLDGVVTVSADFACRLERELNAAQATIRQQQLLDEEIMRLRERVKRLEETGDAMCETYEEIGMDSFDRERIDAWRKAKEENP